MYASLDYLTEVVFGTFFFSTVMLSTFPPLNMVLLRQKSLYQIYNEGLEGGIPLHQWWYIYINYLDYICTDLSNDSHFFIFFSHLQNHENVFYTLDNNLTLFILFKSFTLESLGAPSVNPLCNGLAKNFFVFYLFPIRWL